MNGSVVGTALISKIGNGAVLKYFEPDVFDKFDAEARKVARVVLETAGSYSCQNNPDTFGVDLLVEGKGKKLGVRLR